MRRFLLRCLWFTFRCILGLRYRVLILGEEKLRRLEGPTLVMPNHAAYIDPAIVQSFIHRSYRGCLRPIVLTGPYRNPVLHPLMLLVRALEVPDLGQHSRRATEQARAMIDAVAERIEAGDSFLLYPSGRLQVRGQEVVGAARTASELLQRCKSVNIVLIRTRGLWGSKFGCAWTGKGPDLGKVVPFGFRTFFANLCFFMPRRDVTLTVEVIPREDIPGLDRQTLNPWLEEWYNRDIEIPEKPVFVPYHFLFGPRDHEFRDISGSSAADLEKVPHEVKAEVTEMLESRLGRPLDAEEKSAATTLENTGLDSLERMALSLEIEQRFGFQSNEVGTTLGDLWLVAAGLAASAEEVVAPKEWLNRKEASPPFEVLADTLGEAFVRRALLDPQNVAAADLVSGALTCRKFLTACLLFSRRLKALDGDALGLMLPASVGADICFFGMHLAGKLPVMINWTSGPAATAHAIRTMRLKYIVTSRKLVDRLSIEIEGAEFFFVEDVRKEIGKFEALWTLLSTRFAKGPLLRSLPKPDPDSPAVVLFTSGSEAAPKAVPLSHRNLITNITDTLGLVPLRPDDSVLSFLPPFHSFGLALDFLLELLVGIPMVHHADPTDATILARLSRTYRPTFCLGTPTLIGYVLQAGRPEDYESYRFIILGAEKAPEWLFDRAAEMVPRATVLEGYGITECSPLVAANTPGRIRRGSMGVTTVSLESCVVDSETLQPVSKGERGMLLVRGPSVFSGYLNYDGPSPFVEVGGKQWYKTGDLVVQDEDGFFYFRGRLKRFLKIGGEMVSLPAMEEPLAKAYPPDENGPRIAVEGLDRDDARRIVLFTTFDLDLKTANHILAEAGFRGVHRFDAVKRLESIPLLGTGKTDYKLLKKRVAE